MGNPSIQLSTSFYKDLTYQNVLERVDEYNIYSFYLGYSPEIGKMYKSPFRSDDDTPSFNVIKVSGGYIHKDFGRPHLKGNCFSFVKQLFGINFWEALKRINNDLGLGLGNYITDSNPIIDRAIPQHSDVQNKLLQIKARRYSEEDFQIWNTWDISPYILKEYNVYAVDKLWSNKRLISTGGYAYLIRNKLKIYKPFAKKPRFISNFTKDMVEGFLQIPIRGNKLVLTKSYKDVMMLRVYGYWAVSPTSETTGFPDEFIEYASENWKNIIVFFDNDEVGIQKSNEIISQSGFDQVFMPTIEKDPTDYRKNHSKQETIILLNNLLN